MINMIAITINMIAIKRCGNNTSHAPVTKQTANPNATKGKMPLI